MRGAGSGLGAGAGAGGWRGGGGSSMGLLLVWRHQANIRKLLAGTESKLGQKAASAPPGASAKHPHGTGPRAAGHSHHHPKKK